MTTSTSDGISNQYKLQRVLSSQSIVKYLEARGYRPVIKTGNRYKYLCPMHEDLDPSFVVYVNEGEPENCFCYGCKRGGSIVSLVAYMEGKQIGEALSSLAEGMDLTLDGSLGYIVERIRSEELRLGEIDDPDSIVFLIGRMVYDFLDHVGFASPYKDRCEKMMKLVDDAAMRLDFGKLLDIYEEAPRLLRGQAEVWKKQEDDARRLYSQIQR